jgi:cytochrome c oxidase assembly factor CtaG
MMARHYGQNRSGLMVRRQNERETRKENRAIWFFIVLVALLMILASYGYFSGRWDEWNRGSGYEVGKPK